MRHEFIDGTWRPVFYAPTQSRLESVDPVNVVATEFQGFLAAVEARSTPDANVRNCGVEIAAVVQGNSGVGPAEQADSGHS